MLSLFTFYLLVPLFYALAINELDRSITEVEDIIGLRTNLDFNKRSSQVIEGEIERLRNLLNYAQDIKLIQGKTSEYINQPKHTVVEDDLLEICDVKEVESGNYDELVQSVYNNRLHFDDVDGDYNSDNDSFISAAESIELEVCIFFVDSPCVIVNHG